MANVFLGFPQHSSFLLFLIRALQENYNRSQAVDLRTGNHLLTDVYLKYNDSKIKVFDKAYYTVQWNRGSAKHGWLRMKSASGW